MKGIHFKDAEGKTLRIAWNADPHNYPPSEHFPEGWTSEEIDEEEGIGLLPQSETIDKRFPDPPEQVVRQLKLSHEALIESLEDHLELSRGDLKAMVAAKLTEVK